MLPNQAVENQSQAKLNIIPRTKTPNWYVSMQLFRYPFYSTSNHTKADLINYDSISTFESITESINIVPKEFSVKVNKFSFLFKLLSIRKTKIPSSY